MRSIKKLFAMPIAMACAAFCLVNSSATAQEFESPCESGVTCRVTSKQPYKRIYKALAPYVDQFETLVNALVEAPNTTEAIAAYDALYAASIVLANSITSGRVVVALPDGTVVIDTTKPADLSCTAQCSNCPGTCSGNTNTAPTNPCPNPALANGYCHYITKTVNENHNTRIAVINANQWRCGVGAETKYSTTDGTFQSYVAIRMGDYLDCTGVIRLSVLD